MNFPGGSICSSNRNEFSRRVYNMFFEQTQIFQEGYSKRHVFQGSSICSSNRPYYLIEQILIFPETLILVLEHIRIFQEPLFSHRTDRYSFSRKPYLVLEHLRFSRRPYLVLEHIQFSRRPLRLEHIGIFQEGTPSRTDISLIGLSGCFRMFDFKKKN